MSLSTHLDACAAYAPEYAGALSNHLPMALHALQELGATESRLAAFAVVYGRRLVQLVPLAPPPAASQTPRLGDLTTWSDWLQNMQLRVQTLGAGGAVAEALPRLMPGVSAAAFHGLLRTAHGLAADHAGEVAQGLAYWAARHQPLGAPLDQPLGALVHDPFGAPLQAPSAGLTLPQWWAALTAFGRGQAVDGRLISGRMRAWAARPGFAAVAGGLALETDTLAELARQAAAAYADTGDFTLLHVLTSSWAMQTLISLQPEPAAALRHYTVAVAAGWLACGGGRPAAPLPPPLPGWAALHQAAVASDDDHTAKLVYAAWRWHAVAGHEEFQRAAARAAAGNLRG